MGVPQIDISGNKYGSLTAIAWEKTERYVKKSGKFIYRNYWLFRCDCGKEKIMRKDRVTSGITAIKSCGCSRNENKWQGCGMLSGTYWGIIKKGAEKRGLSFKISKKDAWDKYNEQEGRCVLSGVLIEFVRPFEAHAQTASLDRIDSDVGYEKNNIQWVHRDVNCMKWDMSKENLVEWCRLIFEHNKGD